MLTPVLPEAEASGGCLSWLNILVLHMWFLFSDYCFFFFFFFFNKKVFPLEPAKLLTLQQSGIFCSPYFVCAVVSV